MIDDRDGEVNPDVLFPDRRDFKDLVKVQYGVHRRQDPEHQRAVEQAVRDYAGNPEEADEVLAVIAQLERDANRVILPNDVPGLVDRIRSGEDPREGLRAHRDDREARRRPVMSPSQEDEELRQSIPYRPDKPRGAGFQTLAERTEAKIAAMQLDPEQERTLREILDEMRVQGPNSPGQVEKYTRSLRNGMGKKAILARDGVF